MSRVTRLKQIATGGAASIAVSVAISNALRIVSSMTLTRLLDSHAYGVVGIITSIAYMLTMLSDVGIYTFIVRHKEGDDSAFRDEIWTIRLIRGAILTIVMAAISHPAAAALGKPELAPVIAAWSVNFVIDGLSSLAFATAVREQKLWRMSMLDLSMNVATLIVSVGLAFLWHSYWALIGGMITGALLKCALSYVLFPASRRRLVFRRERSRELWGFSRYIALSSILSIFILQSDKVVLARLMPLATYGLYAIATTLAAAPVALAAPYCMRVLFSAYSHAARTDRASLRDVVYQRRRTVVLLYMFAVAVLIGAAPLVIEILYDPRYRGVSPYLQWITISAVLRMPSMAANQALLAVGRTKSTLYANIFRIVWLAIGGGLGLWTGNIMLLVAIVGTVEVPGIVCFWISMGRAGLLDVAEEGYGLAAAGAGVAAGFALNQAGMMLLAHL